ncbi:MAG: hypothetical protein KBC64_01500 [Simkaniaceae bacterium]|nr:hypothetical protein [Simkaniaceae bacterium]
MGFDKVVIWGHKLHTHTHSYVHNGFFRAFQYLGYPAYWFDDQDDVSDFDFSNALFLTEGQVDLEIPLRKDGVYIIHHCSPDKYQGLKQVCIEVYTDNVLKKSYLKKIEPCIYLDIVGNVIYMPWATHLFPYEIENNKQNLSQVQKQREVHWIGTLGEGVFGNFTEIDPFRIACEENDISFIAARPDGTGIEEDQHQGLITSSYLAPAIVGEWQKRVGYIPCRIFKNISYGQLGVTNSFRVYELFERKIVYNPNSYELFYDAQARSNTITLEELYELMDFVKTKHTYINRIQTILQFLDLKGYLHD